MNQFTSTSPTTATPKFILNPGGEVLISTDRTGYVRFVEEATMTEVTPTSASGTRTKVLVFATVAIPDLAISPLIVPLTVRFVELIVVAVTFPATIFDAVTVLLATTLREFTISILTKSVLVTYPPDPSLTILGDKTC